ncbi:MAG: esterase family protein [bacterium]|nr:esterase family protein [bacterium]
MQPFELPDDVYFEYAYMDAEGNKRPDPNNDRPILNPWWEFASNLSGPEYRPDPLSQIPTRSPQGSVQRLNLKSGILGQTRRVLIYSPAGMAQKALPHILFQDGKAYFGWGKVCQALDQMLGQKKVSPAHLIFVPPNNRTEEYAFNLEYEQFLLDELLPFAESRVPNNGVRIAWGASLGGLLSARVAWSKPGVFQKVVSQSGAFLFSEDMILSNPFAGNESFTHQVMIDQPRPLSWHLQCGNLEWLLESNLNLLAALKKQGMSARLIRKNAGHNWINWRNGLTEGLLFALGGAPAGNGNN